MGALTLEDAARERAADARQRGPIRANISCKTDKVDMRLA